MQIIILAGGKGTRLLTFSKKPKIFLKFGNTRLIDLYLKIFKNFDTKNISFILGNKGKDIKKDRILYKGDIIILFKGGHGFKFYKKTKIIEIKQGPYVEGKDKKILK